MHEPDSHRLAIESREDLVAVLSEASTLEHMIMCEYLFAAFSLKQDESEGISTEQLENVRSWGKVVTTVAVQEMTHMALVNNMLVSVGAAPYFQHPNFPQPSRYFPPNVRLALIPFGEQALRHFLYLERPEGMSIEGVPGFEVLGDLNPPELKGGVAPAQQYYSTVGNLYRGIEAGFEDLVSKYSEDGVFIGGNFAQASEETFGLASLKPVSDLASAKTAIQGIVEMGEGARGDWKHSHFGMFLGVFKELMDAKGKGWPSPTRPVTPAFTRAPPGSESATVVTDPRTARASELFNESYVLAIETLSRFYVHEEAFPQEQQALADTAVGIMAGVLGPLGRTLTTLPVGPRLPGVTAGPTFELRNREYVLPHRLQAFMVLQERLVELSAKANSTAESLGGGVSGRTLKSVSHSLASLAGGLQTDSLQA